MARKRGDEGSTRLLDAWDPPPGAGDPIGCIATTFTFDPTFFEEHCLSRFLRLETDPRENAAAYLINREEKLAEAKVCVLVDRSHADGSASPRCDIMSVTVPNRIFHAKVSVLAWHGWVRVLVSSANLTEPGYRQNQEVVGLLDFHDGGQIPIERLSETLAFVDRISAFARGSTTDAGPKARLLDFTRAIGEAVKGWQVKPLKPRESPDVRLVYLGPLDGYREPVPRRLGQLMRERGGPAHSASVLSPFFDEGSSNPYPGTTELLGALTDRGSREVEFLVPIERLPNDKIRARAPRSLVKPGKKAADFHVYPVSDDIEKDIRSLHAKSLWLWNDSWHVYMVGSSNFTSSGMGLPGSPPNIEANLAYIFPEDGKIVRLMKQTLPAYGDELKDLDAVAWAPTTEDDGEGTSDQPILPQGFEEALFEPSGFAGSLSLHFGRALPTRWSSTTPDNGAELYSSRQWDAAGKPGVVTLPWPYRYAPNELGVQWHDTAGTSQAAQWPVNVTDPRRLPPPDDLRNLPLETLLEILSSRLPLHEAVALAKEARGMGPGGADAPSDIDPLKRVRSETFLLQRTRRVAKAIERLVETLNRPVAHADALHWRLRGPVGPLALARALAEEAKSAGEGCFLLTEVVLALRRVNIPKIAVGVTEDFIRQALNSVKSEIEQMARTQLGAADMPPGMVEYVSEALSEKQS